MGHPGRNRINLWRSGVLALAMLLIAALGAAAALAASSAQDEAPAAAPPAAPAGDPVHGQMLFDTVGCWECHGYAAQGGVGPKLSPNPIPFTAFQGQVRVPRAVMPHYSTAALSDQDLADIYAFVQSVPPSPAVQDIPLLSSQ